MNNNSVFIMVISLFIVIFVIVSYFILTDSLFDEENGVNKFNGGGTTQSNNSNSYSSCDPEVFHIRDNKFSYKDAKAVCLAHRGRLATLDEMTEAYKKGANWCNYGWSDEQLALYPIQKGYHNELQKDENRKYECGVPGLNGGFFQNENYKFGVNCYGVKPEFKGSAVDKHKFRTFRRNDSILKSALNMDIQEHTVAPFSNYVDSYNKDIPWGLNDKE